MLESFIPINKPKHNAKKPESCSIPIKKPRPNAKLLETSIQSCLDNPDLDNPEYSGSGRNSMGTDFFSVKLTH